MATQSSVLAWRIPGTGEPGGLPSMGLHRVGHNWSSLAAAATHTAHLPPSATSAASTTFSHVQSFSELPLSNASVGILFLCLHPTILPFRLGEVCVCVLVAQLHLTLCDPMVCSLPGSPVHGILQARALESVAIPFSRERYVQ